MRVAGLVVLATLAATAASAAEKDIALLRPADIGESEPALAVVQKALAAKNYNLKEIVVSGEGASGMTATIAEGKTGAAAALLNGQQVRTLADQRKLGDISANASNGAWVSYALLPTQPYLTSHGRWVAAPLDVMPLNGLWINSALMNKVGGAAPTTIEGLFSLLDRAREAGVTPLAVGGSPRELALLFEQVVIATAGVGVYKNVFMDANEMAIQSDEMIRAFEAFARLRSYVAKDDTSLDSKAAIQRVVKGDALAFAGPGSTDVQFTAAGKVADKDYLCLRFPGTGAAILYQMDIIAMVKASPDQWAAQSALADVVMDPQVQADASLAKGSVPARGDTDTSKFGACAMRDVNDVQVAAAAGNFVGSTAYGFTQSAAATAAYIDVVTKFYRGEIPTAEAAATALRDALIASR